MTPLYRLIHLEHRYGPRTVLRIHEMAVERSALVALVGPSGAGKSTLLRLMALLETPSTGVLDLKLDGRRIDGPRAALVDKRRIVLMFQRPVMLSRSVRDNIAYGLRVRGRSAPHEVDRLITRLGLEAVAGARPATLSGGELQRAALARALVVQPDVLLLDEPTANLDPENVRLIEQILREEHKQRDMTTVIVTHNLFQARRLATHIGVLLDGDLIEYGPAERVLHQPGDPRTQAFFQGDLVF